MKVIHILIHSIPFKENYIFDGWSARLAKNTQKFSAGYTHECWFAVNNITQPQTIFKDDIKYRLFPAKTLNVLLESFYGIVFSRSLLMALKEEIKRDDIIFQLQGERGLLLPQIIKIIKGKPIFLQFHGYYAPLFLIPLEKIFIKPWEKYYFRFVNYFLVHAKARINYLIEKCEVAPTKIISQNLGVDYNFFYPTDKLEARQKLDLPPDKNIILFVGSFGEVKGVKKIVKANQKIRDASNTFLILIGGSIKDKYYQYCLKRADLVLERISHDLLSQYYNVADVYCVVCKKRKSKFGGVGVAPAEALACDLPLLSSSLGDMPPKLRPRLGFTVYSVKDLIHGMTYIFQNKEQYQNLREMSRPYLSLEAVILNILQFYKQFKINEK